MNNTAQHLNHRELRELEKAQEHIKSNILFGNGTLQDMQQRMMESTYSWQTTGNIAEGISLPISLSTQIETYPDQKYIRRHLPKLVYRDSSLSDLKLNSDHASHSLVLRLYSWITAAIHRCKTGASQAQAETYVTDHLHKLRRELVQHIDFTHEMLEDYVEHDKGGDCFLGCVAIDLFAMALMTDGNAFKFSMNRDGGIKTTSSIDHRSEIFGMGRRSFSPGVSIPTFDPSFCTLDWSMHLKSVEALERMKTRVLEVLATEVVLFTPKELVHKIYEISDPEFGNLLAIFVSRFHFHSGRRKDILDLIILKS